MKETEIQRAILDYLMYKGILCWRNQSIPVPIRRGREIVGLRRADPHTVGQPDIMALVRPKNALYGVLVGIEVKGAKGRLSPEQEAWRDKIVKAGGVWILARSIEDVEQGLAPVL